MLCDHNVNNAYVTGAFCYKEQYGQTYDYDKNGNVVSAVDLAKTNSTFSYYGNQMAKMLNPSGSKYLYDYNDKKQLTYALSSDGQQYGFTYDDKGNVTKAEITARKPTVSIESGKEYLIVNSYSGLAIDSNKTGKAEEIATTYHYMPTNTQQHWKAELVSGTTDVFMLRSVKFTDKNYYLDVKGGVNAYGTVTQTYPYNGTNAQKFKAVLQDDGTFGLFTACSNYTKCLDGQENTGKEIWQSQSVKQVGCTADKLTEGQKWYFYPVEQSEAKTIATETTYTDSKNFVKSTKDQRGNETTYAYNEQKGTLTSTADALGRTTNYTYDPNNNSLLSVSSGGMTNSYAYENDRLKNITVNGGLQYAFQYDAFGRTTSTKVGNGTAWRTLSSLQYNSKGLLGKQTYGNGDYIEFTYDNLDRITEKKYNGSETNRAVYRYGNDGSLAQTIDFSTGTRTKFAYDLADRLVSQKEYTGTGNNGGTLRSSTDFTYADKTNYLTGVRHFSPLGTQNIGYTYGDINQGQMPDQIYKVSWNGQERLHYVYDPLGRLKDKSVILSGNEESPAEQLHNYYTYADVGTDKTTTLVQSLQTELGTFNYAYDAVGNITGITFGDDAVTYEYDALNQLIRENNAERDWTITYDYQNGNITEMRLYAYTTGSLDGMPYEGIRWSYTDSTWGDLLTDFTGISGVNGGTEPEMTAAYASARVAEAAQTVFADTMLGRALQQQAARNRGISLMSAENPFAFTYDEIGNPTSMLGIQMSWSGRQLQQVIERDRTYSYQYNTDGQRVSKTVDGVTTEFFYNGSILAGQKTDDNILVLLYDNNGDVFGFSYNGTEYYYIKNAQNDVVAIADGNKNIIAKYFYSAYGVVSEITDANGNDVSYVAGHPANVNPIRYRSYYYDDETDFYYLNSRYYSPELCRFLNADAVAQTGQGLLDKNMFAYCGNNPVNRLDSNGNKWADVKQWISDKWNRFTNWVDRTFGVSGQNVVEAYSPSISTPDYLPISQKTQEKITTVSSRTGKTKAVTASYKFVTNNIKKSSVGLSVKIKKFSLNVSYSPTGLSIMGSYTNGDITQSLGYQTEDFGLTLSGVYQTTVKWDENVSSTVTTTTSLNGLSLFMCMSLYDVAANFNVPQTSANPWEVPQRYPV